MRMRLPSTSLVDPAVMNAALEAAAGAEPPSGVVVTKDGTARRYDLTYVMKLVQSDHDLRTELDQAWCVSSLIMLGDRLAAESYFDRAPVLEMVRHLRNGVAHGNRFTIREPAQLHRWPAHTRDAACRSGLTFEVTRELDGLPSCSTT